MPPVPQTRQASRSTSESSGTPDILPKASLLGSREQYKDDVCTEGGRGSTTTPAGDSSSLTQSAQRNGLPGGGGSGSSPGKSSLAPDSRKALSRRSGETGVGRWETIPVSLRSPTPSEFGAEFHDPEMRQIQVLPDEVYQYLDDRGLEAYGVASDGNCLYRALTFGPQVSKHDLARKGDAGYLTALQHGNNALDYLNNQQLDEIRMGSDAQEFH